MPLKGLHVLLKAMAVVKRTYPDIMLRIAGDDITKIKTISDIKYYTGYGKIIRDLIKRLKLEDNVHFLGRLNAESMKSEYLSANVYVLSSSIENSPNSLGEAQLLGVPCIASYVGGVPDMIPCKDCGLLYRYDDFRVLALLIVDVFKNSPIFDNTVMRQVAASRHSPDANCLTLLGIYNTIIG
jgi:glycosyltransferase involved in cell wall biosynthesis